MSFAFHYFSEEVLAGRIIWTTGFYGACLMKDTYTPSPEGVRYLADLNVTHRPQPIVQVLGRALVDGAADSFDIVFPRVPELGYTYKGIVIFQNTGVEASSKLLVYHDSGVGWPVTPNNGNIVVQVDDGADRLFRIGTYEC